MAARSLMAEVAQACHAPQLPTEKPRYSERRLAALNAQTKWFLVCVAVFLVVVLVFPNWLPGDWLTNQNNLHMVVRWIVILVPVGLAVAAKKRLRRASQRTDVHDSCVQQLTHQFPELRDARLARVRGPAVNVLPRLASDGEPVLRCSLFGEFRGQPLAMFESDYAAGSGLGANHLLDSVEARLGPDPDQEQFSRARTAEAIVFFRPQPQLPDLFLAGRAEPLSAHQHRWVKQAGGAPPDSQVSTSLDPMFDTFSSCPAAAARLFSAALTELLTLRPSCLVQVIGGFVVVVPRSWNSATPMSTAVAAFEIQLDLEFACAVYDALFERATSAVA